MAEDERTKKNNELKIKKRDYTGYDDDEFSADNQGMKRSVLAKYDEDIEGTRDTVSNPSTLTPACLQGGMMQGFRLGSSIVSAKAARAEQNQEAAALVNKSLLSIDYISTCSNTSRCTPY
jgi:SART-1 family.